MYRNYIILYLIGGFLFSLSISMIHHVEVVVGVSVKQTIFQSAACLFIILMMIYFIAQFLKFLFPSSWTSESRDKNGDYQSVVEQGSPRLTVSAIWQVVYGVGLVIYANFMVFSFETPYISYFFVLGLFILCCDDFINPVPCDPPLSSRASYWIFLSAILCEASILISMALNVDVWDGFMSLSLMNQIAFFSFFYLCPNILGLVRSSPQIPFCNSWGVFEFGMPFAFILSVFCLMQQGLPTVENLNLFWFSVNYTCKSLLNLIAALFMISGAIRGRLKIK